ncbi:MAG: hypothetical protein ABI895_08500 [Deltaproteobacteria bacterium]
MSTTHKPLVPVPITRVDSAHTSQPPASGAPLASGDPSGSVRLPAAAERASGAPPSRPSPVPEISSGKVPVEEFADERPAVEHLRSGGSQADWEQRAQWLEAEAKAQPDAAARSRLLLAASEVRALLGARVEARRLADQAATLGSPGLSARQARALALAQTDVSAALRSLQEEARAARLPATRAHAYYVIAELLRMLRREDGESEQRLEAAEQSDPTDHRATLQRLVRQLAHTQRPPDVRFRPDEALKSLRQATGQLRQLRGSEAPRLGPQDLAAQPLVETQRALGRGRLAEAADALGQLEAQPGLSAAVHFLTTLWRVLPKSEPEEVLAAVRRLAQRHPGRLELRTWAGRALAAGSRAALVDAFTAAERAATESASRSGMDAVSSLTSAFSQHDRAALNALAAGAATSGDPTAAVSVDPQLRPLQLARERLSAGGQRPSSSSTSALEFALGRALLRVDASDAVESLLAALPETPWSNALRVERDREQGDLAALVRDLFGAFAQHKDQPELRFFAGALAEKVGDIAAAREHYSAALPSHALREAALRALRPKSRDGAALLRALAAQVEDGSRRALLLTEALLHMAPDTAEFDAVAEEAWRADPDLPWAADLAEVGARMRGDRERVGRWLGRQRERAQGDADGPLSAIREARFLALNDPPAAVERLRQLERPDAIDWALRHQIETLVPGTPGERVDFRLRAADRASPRARERWLAEASELEYAQGNVRSAVNAAQKLSSALGRLRVEECARDPEDLAWLSAEWSRELDQLEDNPEACVELLERLARLDRERGATERAQAFRWRLLEQNSLPLATLRFVEAESMQAGAELDLERSATRLSEQLAESDALGHLFLAARLRIDRGGFPDSAPLAARAAAQATPPLWALRLSLAHARNAGDDRRQLVYGRELRERARQPLDAATLSLRAAEAAARLNELELAATELSHALEIAPEHVVALALRAELLQSQNKPAEAAEAFENLAATSQCQPRRVEALYRASLLWLDRLADRDRAIAALEEAAAVGLPHPGVQERLRALRPIATTEYPAPPRALDPSSESELTRIAALRESGQATTARSLLSALLAREPNNGEALHLSALLLLDAGDAPGAERSWRALEASALPRELRLTVLRALAALYEGALRDAEQARRVYGEILLEDAEDDETRRRLVKNLTEATLARDAALPEAGVASRDSTRRPAPLSHEDAALQQDAILHQRELLLRAPDDDQRRQTLLELVPLLTHTPEGQREAESLLEQAHRTWPDSAEVLEAQVEHYRRVGNANTARVLLERAIHGARNAVLAGRLEPGLFRMLGQAARLGGDAEGARVAQVALAALEGQAVRIAGAGAQAGQQRFDDLIAPAPLSSGFRRLLYGAGAAIERAYATDATTLNLTSMPEAQAAQVRTVASAFGLHDVRVAISDELGCDCITVFGSPLLVVFGRPLLAHENPRVRDFLLLRSLKIAQVNACALSRMSANELWSAVAGFLACFSTPWRADAEDAQRLVAARNRIRPHVTATLSQELNAMTAALTSNIVPQAAQLGDALWRWASRVALFGVGELGVALESLSAVASGRTGTPKDLDTRIRWIAGSSPARDLVGYGVSEAYTEARRRAGLVTPAR